MKTVVIVYTYNRPEYTRQCMQHLEIAMQRTGMSWINDVYVMADGVPNMQEGVKEVYDVLHEYPVAVLKVPQRLGCNANIERGFRHAFDVCGADYAIFVEDDILLSPDAIECFRYLGMEYAQHESLLSATVYNRSVVKEGKNDVWIRKHFTPWGWATWKKNREVFLGTFEINRRDEHVAWDTALCNVNKDRLLEVYPGLSRSQNIGVEKGTYMKYGKEWHDNNQRVPFVAGVEDAGYWG